MNEPTPAVYLDYYFNSKAHHEHALRDPFEDPCTHESMPTDPNGITNPWGAGTEGIQVWRSEWGVVDPNPSNGLALWLPGLRTLQVSAKNPTRWPHYTPVSGNQLIIRGWDYQGKSPTNDVPNADVFIQIVTKLWVPGPKPDNFESIEPNTVFTGKDGVPLPPSDNETCCLSLHYPQAPVRPIVSPFSASQPSPQDQPIATLQFVDLSKPPFNQLGTYLKVVIAVFATITTSIGDKIRFFDDPEMDVDQP